MKIYVVGSVASGKTTFTKKLSKHLSIDGTHLDELVHIKDESNKKWGNIRRPDDEIDCLFQSILKRPTWIVEDAGRVMFNEAMVQADVIVHLDPSRLVRKFRITSRFIKQKLGLEECLYTPNLKMLKAMYDWSFRYDKGLDDLKVRLSPYAHKSLVLKNNKEIQQYMKNTCQQ